MDTIHLYRRRYMPDETVELKDDLILYRDDNILVTKWNILKPRKDIDHGISVYYMKDGFKMMYCGRMVSSSWIPSAHNTSS